MWNCRLWRWLFRPTLKELSPREAGELGELPRSDTIVSEQMVPPINAGAEFRLYSPTAEGPLDTVISAQGVLILPPAEEKSKPLIPPKSQSECADAPPLPLPESAGEALPSPSIPVIPPHPTYLESWIRERARYFSSKRYAVAVVESFLVPD